MRQATYAAVIVAITLITMKSVTFYLTDSVAMLGTLVDSLLDGAASLLNLIAIRHSLTPADDEHRFGHGKVEALAGLGQAAFIVGSAGFIVYKSINRLITPEPVAPSWPGIIMIIVAIILTLGLVAFQRHVVARTGSLAIDADSLHYRGDLLMNLAALLALFLSGILGLHWADAVGGVLIALLIGYSAWRIVISSYGQLMDAELDDVDRDRIMAIARSHSDVLGIHDLRTRKAGIHTFIQFRLELDGDLSLTKVHMISNDVETCIIEAFPDAEVIIHQDPAGLVPGWSSEYATD